MVQVLNDQKTLENQIGMVELGQTALATKIGEVRIIKVKEVISNMAVPLVVDLLRA